MKYRKLLPATALFVWGVLISLYYGRIAFMPLDQSIVFDGAWRLLSGQIPFHDYTSPNAWVPIFLQVPFFKLFGVNWFSYCLHAAVLNGLFCLMVYAVMRQFGASILLSTFYGLMSGIVFYPPFGVPVSDQHSFCFTMLAVFMSIIAVRMKKQTRLRTLIWLLVPLVMVLAYFSKQIPSTYGLPVILWILFVIGKGQRKRTLFLMSVSTGAIFLLLWSLVKVWRLDINDILYYLFQLPSSIGGERLKWIAQISHIKSKLLLTFALWRIPITPPLMSIWCLLVVALFSRVNSLKNLSSMRSGVLLVPGLIYAACNVVAWLSYSQEQGQTALIGISVLLLIAGLILFSFAVIPSVKLDSVSRILVDSLPEASIPPMVMLISVAFGVLTNNAPENGIPIVFFCLGITHVLTQKVIANTPIKDENNRTLKTRRLLSLGFGLLCIIAAAMDGWHFNSRVNSTRVTHDLTYVPTGFSEDKHILPPGLDFMIWAIPPFYKTSARDLSQLVTFFSSNKGNFWLVGDSSILYGLTKRPSVSPVLWYHEGLTFPLQGTKEYREFEDKLMQNLAWYNVKYIVLEGRETWTGFKIRDLPRVVHMVNERKCGYKDIGAFRVIEMCI